MEGEFTSLAVDRLGHHTVTKLFKALPFKEKLEMAQELLDHKSRLGGSSIGRSVMDECCVRELLDSEDAWTRAVHLKEEKDSFLADIVSGGAASTGKKKRKRKRKANSNIDLDE
jgi:hypothetical protein